MRSQTAPHRSVQPVRCVSISGCQGSSSAALVSAECASPTARHRRCRTTSPIAWRRVSSATPSGPTTSPARCGRACGRSSGTATATAPSAANSAERLASWSTRSPHRPTPSAKPSPAAPPCVSLVLAAHPSVGRLGAAAPGYFAGCRTRGQAARGKHRRFAAHHWGGRGGRAGRPQQRRCVVGRGGDS